MSWRKNYMLTISNQIKEMNPDWWYSFKSDDTNVLAKKDLPDAGKPFKNNITPISLSYCFLCL